MKTEAQKRAKLSREKRVAAYYKEPNICKHCGAVIEVGEAKVSEVRRKQFCDRSCAATFNNARRPSTAIIHKISDKDFIKAVEDSSSYSEVARTIGYASPRGSNIEDVKNRMLKLEIDFCSSKAGQSIEKLTKGELFSKRANWQSARSSIATHAKRVYDNSTKSKECQICGYDKHYQVAHIEPVASFSDDALILEINSIDNLVALCPNCHWEFDNLQD